jgi:hypothetical protein
MAHTHAADEHVMYAVTSRSNRRGVANGVLSASTLRSLLRNCMVKSCAAVSAAQLYGKHISAAVNQHTIIEEGVFPVGPPQRGSHTARIRIE